MFHTNAAAAILQLLFCTLNKQVPF